MGQCEHMIPEKVIPNIQNRGSNQVLVGCGIHEGMPSWRWSLLGLCMRGRRFSSASAAHYCEKLGGAASLPTSSIHAPWPPLQSQRTQKVKALFLRTSAVEARLSLERLLQSPTGGGTFSPVSSISLLILIREEVEAGWACEKIPIPGSHFVFYLKGLKRKPLVAKCKASLIALPLGSTRVCLTGSLPVTRCAGHLWRAENMSEYSTSKQVKQSMR